MRRSLLALASLVIALIGAEVGVRAFVRVDQDGQRWLGEQRLLPWRLPLSGIGERLNQLDDRGSLLRYDADLGWAPRPGARSADGRTSIDGNGFRRDGSAVQGEISATRIVTLGDSFTFGDEVADADSWPAQLEHRLQSQGRASEVINLGVNGYALDQAVLRFERDGIGLAPDVVILGLQPENLMRNLNVLRPFYFPDTSVPLSKPRFVPGTDGFDLVNQPTIEPSALYRVYEEPSGSVLLDYEGWLDARYRASLWYESALLALVATVVSSPERQVPSVRLTPEMASVGTHVIERLARAVDESGARLILVHVPRREEMESIRLDRPVWYEPWLVELQERYEVVRPELEFEGETDDAFEAKGHYSASQNRSVARFLADRL